MARETKEERIVRGMTAPLNEHLLELKALSNTASRESELESWCQAVLKSVLGYSASAGYAVRAQETRGKMRFDLVVSRAEKPDEVLFVIEVKKLGSNLDKADFRSGKTQLSEYVSALGNTRWGFLTNGYEWRLYDFKSGAISVATTDIRNDAQDLDTSSKGVQEAAWDLLDFSAHSFESKIWTELSTEAQALSPDSLARAVLSADIVARIRKTLNEEHGYRATVEGLTDKLAELLELGLNELGSGWNESKRSELDRYIRNQKRQAKRSRKRRASGSEVGAESEVPTRDDGSSDPGKAAA